MLAALEGGAGAGQEEGSRTRSGAQDRPAWSLPRQGRSKEVRPLVVRAHLPHRQVTFPGEAPEASPADRSFRRGVVPGPGAKGDPGWGARGPSAAGTAYGPGPEAPGCTGQGGRGGRGRAGASSLPARQLRLFFSPPLLLNFPSSWINKQQVPTSTKQELELPHKSGFQ